eukprot:3728231-Pyramimonas_sp.AAC.1
MYYVYDASSDSNLVSKSVSDKFRLAMGWVLGFIDCKYGLADNSHSYSNDVTPGTNSGTSQQIVHILWNIGLTTHSYNWPNWSPDLSCTNFRRFGPHVSYSSPGALLRIGQAIMTV